MPSPKPPTKACHKPVSQNVPRRRGKSPLSIDWKRRAADALPLLMQHRALVNPANPAYMHWSEAVGHMQVIIDGSVTANKQAKDCFALAMKASARALNLRHDG